MKPEKPVKNAVFVVIYHPEEEDRFLSVKRPEDDEDNPGMWGLPATSLDQDEEYHEGVRRIGRDKLGVELEITGYIGRGTAERDDYIIVGDEYVARVLEGGIELPEGDSDRTRYADWKWAEPDDIRPIAREGSLCTNIYLDHLGEETYMDF